MITDEMKNLLRDALSIEDSFKRSWAYSRAVVKLGSIEELEEARAFVQSLPDELRARALDKDGKDFDITNEIEVRNDWIPHLASVDSALNLYPRVEKRVQGIGYKVALLEFADYCSCDVEFVCRLLEDIIKEFESGTDKVELGCGDYRRGQWEHNDYSSVLSAIAHFTQRPCWVLKYLFLPERGSSGKSSDHKVFFKRKEVEAS